LETVSLHNDSATLDRNRAALERLVVAMGAPTESDPVRTRGASTQEWKGFLWNGVPGEAVADFFEGYSTHHKARKVNSDLLQKFVRSMANVGELTSWTVAVIGGGASEPFLLPGGLAVNPLQRKADDSIKDRYSIGRLLSPRDEAIDLDEAAWSAALESTLKAWKPDPGRQTDSAKPKPPEAPNGPAVRRVRGKGADGVPPALERGLLLLYLLDPAKAEGNFGGRTAPIVAFGASFPTSASGVKVEYKVDHLLWETEYGPAD
jgi:hypothetical protein